MFIYANATIVEIYIGDPFFRNFESEEEEDDDEITKEQALRLFKKF